MNPRQNLKSTTPERLNLTDLKHKQTHLLGGPWDLGFRVKGLGFRVQGLGYLEAHGT